MDVLSVATSVQERAGHIIAGFGFYNPWVEETLNAVLQTELGWYELLYIVQQLERNPQGRTPTDIAVRGAVLALGRAKLREKEVSRDSYLRDVETHLKDAGV